MRGGVEGPGVYDALGDCGGFFEHFQLVVFGGEKVEARVVGRVCGDFFVQDLDVPVVLAAAAFGIGRRGVVNADVRFPQTAAGGEDCGINGFVDASAVAVIGLVGKEAYCMVDGGGVMALYVVACVFIGRNEVFDERYGGAIQCLIGVENENPFAGGLRERVISGGGEVDEGEIERDHLCAVMGGDVRG